MFLPHVQYINKEYHRTGTLWEGRHKDSLVQAEKYLLTCSRYIELNPVAASMVGHPAEYRWSSFLCKALGKADPLISPHDVYFRLGSASGERHENYLRLFDHAIDPADVQRISNAALISMPLGSSRFKEQIERALNRQLVMRIMAGHAGRNERISK